jgi:hypothetical protein
MLPIIIQAAENFCLHQLRLPYQRIAEIPQKRTLLAYIDIEADDGTLHRAYIGCDDILIQTISETFLGEEDSDEQTLIDMLLETTNMIVGSAKVLAKELHEISLTIATPFLASGNSDMTVPDDVQWIKVDHGDMMIALKRL